MKIQITKVPNSRAEGGWLSHTHGAIFDSGVDWINEGGSHEENPYGGVMVGSDEQGIPNLVIITVVFSPPKNPPKPPKK